MLVAVMLIKNGVAHYKKLGKVHYFNTVNIISTHSLNLKEKKL